MASPVLEFDVSIVSLQGFKVGAKMFTKQLLASNLNLSSLNQDLLRDDGQAT